MVRLSRSKDSIRCVHLDLTCFSFCRLGLCKSVISLLFFSSFLHFWFLPFHFWRSQQGGKDGEMKSTFFSGQRSAKSELLSRDLVRLLSRFMRATACAFCLSDWKNNRGFHAKSLDAGASANRVRWHSTSSLSCLYGTMLFEYNIQYKKHRPISRKEHVHTSIFCILKECIKWDTKSEKTDNFSGPRRPTKKKGQIIRFSVHLINQMITGKLHVTLPML
jgi:hypothetical protein